MKNLTPEEVEQVAKRYYRYPRTATYLEHLGLDPKRVIEDDWSDIGYTVKLTDAGGTVHRWRCPWPTTWNRDIFHQYVLEDEAELSEDNTFRVSPKK